MIEIKIIKKVKIINLNVSLTPKKNIAINNKTINIYKNRSKNKKFKNFIFR